MLAVQARLQGAEAAAAGVVRIGAPDGFGVGFLAPRLARLAERHPGLDGPARPDAARLLALAARGRPRGDGRPPGEGPPRRPQADRLHARSLCRAGLPRRPPGAARTRPTSPHHRLVGYVEDLIAAPALNYAAEFLRGWRSTVELTSAIGQVEAVRAGAGIGVLHDYLTSPAGATSSGPAGPPRVRSYWLAIHESLRDVARVRAAADWLTDVVLQAHGAFAGRERGGRS